MQIILEPTVTVVGHSTFVEHPIYKIPADGDDATKLGSFAAKGCYDSYGESGRANEANQDAVIESLHGSVLEHGTVSLFIEGVTRGLTLELNRHRTFAISQRSTRYTKEEDAAIVLDPYYSELFTRHKIVRNPHNPLLSSKIGGWGQEGKETYNDDSIIDKEISLIATHLNYAESAINEYQREVEMLIELNPNKLDGFDLRKWARGKARNILPHALETRGTYTNNHRGWRWFIEARSSRHAEPEIRRLAHHVICALRTVAPLYYQDFEINEIVDGIPEYVPIHKKV